VLHTDEQFRASLDEHLGLKVTDEDFQHLVQKYGQEKPGRMNYKAFVNVIENGNVGWGGKLRESPRGVILV
jgi:Ca2+-binding EF-hand superfamily protein